MTAYLGLDDEIATMTVLAVGPGAGRIEEILRTHGFKAVAAIADPADLATAQTDVVVLDTETDAAVDALHALGETAHPIPVVALARGAGSAARLRAAGAGDVVSDGSDDGEIVARVRSVLQMRALRHMLRDASLVLEDRVRERTRELHEARSEVLERLVVAAEFRDDDTRDHTRRVGETAALLAAASGMEPEEAETIRLAAPLHDIGKIGVADAVLLKQGPLSDEEFSAIRIHSVIGARILWGTHAPVLKSAGEIALCHHERWDGRGYPTGFAGQDIPVSARIAAVADVFDALTHDRPYKKAWPVERALNEIATNAGTQLDPRLSALFVDLVNAGSLERIEWT